jgi:hypothetical protein
MGMLEKTPVVFPNVVIPALRELRRGQSMIYYTGFLTKDRGPPNDEISQIASAAWALFESGYITLVQRRLSENVYQYIAQGRGGR